MLYYLLKEESAVKALLNELGDEDGKRKLKKHSVDDITKEQVEQILQEIIQSQQQMKGYMKELISELLSKSLTFEQTYQRVKDVQPSDPLDKYGLSMTDFDQMLDKHQNDPKVRDAIAKIMGAPNPSNASNEKVQGITVKQIIEVHSFMLKELEDLVAYFQTLPNKESFDMKTVTIAAQGMVESKVQQSFSISSDEIESAVLMHHAMLATDQEFADVNVKIQLAMQKLMGKSFTPA